MSFFIFWLFPFTSITSNQKLIQEPYKGLFVQSRHCETPQATTAYFQRALSQSQGQPGPAEDLMWWPRPGGCEGSCFRSQEYSRGLRLTWPWEPTGAPLGRWACQSGGVAVGEASPHPAQGGMSPPLDCCHHHSPLPLLESHQPYRDPAHWRHPSYPALSEPGTEGREITNKSHLMN